MMFRVIQFCSVPSIFHAAAQTTLIAGLSLLLVGCGAAPPAEFKFRATTDDLIPDAKKAVKATLKESFGTPNELVAWERFPIAYGGVKGAVASIDDNHLITVAVEGDATKIRKDAPIQWLTGDLASSKSAQGKVVSYNADSKVLKISAAESPKAGDRFAVGFGDDFQFGRQVYMRNCMHCHGVSGDGAGPTAEFLNPRPRDYRNGQFKFTSTKAGEKACRDDLTRIVKYGVPGTYMPSFLLLGERETKSVVEYIRWLAIRGEFERRLVADLSADFSEKSIADSVKKAEAAYAEKRKNKEEAEKPPTVPKAIKTASTEFGNYSKEDYPAGVEETANLLADAWTRAEDPETVIVPSVHRVADTADSRERGRLLYLSDKTKCYTCHGITGRGDGGANEDFWPKPGSTEKYANRGLHDEWGFRLAPRNLTLGQYRGGRRPVDLFRRLYAGIKGTPMPAFGGTALKDEEIWDIVNYVMSVPYSKDPTPTEPHKENLAKVEQKPAAEH